MNSIVFGQHHRRVAPVPFRDDVELCFVDGVARKYAPIGLNSVIVQRLISSAQVAIVTTRMPFDEFSEIDTMLLGMVEAVPCDYDLT